MSPEGTADASPHGELKPKDANVGLRDASDSVRAIVSWRIGRAVWVTSRVRRRAGRRRNDRRVVERDDATIALDGEARARAACDEHAITTGVERSRPDARFVAAWWDSVRDSIGRRALGAAITEGPVRRFIAAAHHGKAVEKFGRAAEKREMKERKRLWFRRGRDGAAVIGACGSYYQ